MRYVLVFFAFWVGLTATPALAATYEETFTPKSNKAYNEDINVWVYTSEFAERFAMPEQWVDDDLKGAYAVAFRVETRSNLKRFPHKGPDVTMSIRDCILDVYIPDSADIPWIDDRMSDRRWLTPSSPAYLATQTPEDKEWRWRSIGIPVSGRKSKEPLVYLGIQGNKVGGSLSVREYDKRVYPGISYISFSRSCMTPPKSESWIEFMKDGRWDYGKHLVSDVAYRINIPASFMRRLYDKWYEKSRSVASGEWSDVIKGQGN